VRAALFILVGIKFQNQRHLKFKEKTFFKSKEIIHDTFRCHADLFGTAQTSTLVSDWKVFHCDYRQNVIYKH